MWHKITTVSHLKALYTVRKRPKEVLGNSATTQSILFILLVETNTGLKFSCTHLNHNQLPQKLSEIHSES